MLVCIFIAWNVSTANTQIIKRKPSSAWIHFAPRSLILFGSIRYITTTEQLESRSRYFSKICRQLLPWSLGKKKSNVPFASNFAILKLVSAISPSASTGIVRVAYFNCPNAL
jgi:hypothetical protein